MDEQRVDGGPGDLAGTPQARAVPVGHASAADRYPAVRSALQVRVHVAGVAQRLRTLPAYPRPDVIGKRLRDDHRAVHREEAPPQSWDPGGVALGRANHPGGGYSHPGLVVTRPGAIDSTRVSSYSEAPRRSTAPARPLTSFAGWIRAQ